MQFVQILLGMCVFIGIPFALSENRRAVRWRGVAMGLALQLAVAIVLLKVPFLQNSLLVLNNVVTVLEEVTREATAFLFGYLAGGDAPFETNNPAASYIVAFRVLPLILVVSALSALLFHWRILPFFINLFAKVLVRAFGISGPLGFGAGSTIFLGTIEAPLIVRPYLQGMSRGELLALLTCTMSTIAGTVMILYATVVGKVVENALGHMLIASLISVPAALMLSRIWVPGEEQDTKATIKIERESHSAMDAVIRGTLDGMTMIIQIVAVIIVLFALIYLVNRGLAALPFVGSGVTLQSLLGQLLRPVMWLIGIPWDEAAAAGSLMGTKIVLNEFVAYLGLSSLASDALSPTSRVIVTYALCGFANLGSLGIVIGGLGAILPERREEIARLGVRSILLGNLATLMTGCVVGLVLLV